MNVKKLLKSLALLLCCAAMLVQRPAHAYNDATLYVTIDNAPATYLIELFQVGAPYPSRQTTLTAGYYGWLHWEHLVDTQTYFVRVTNTTTHVVRQTGAFKIHYSSEVDLDGNPSSKFVYSTINVTGNP